MKTFCKKSKCNDPLCSAFPRGSHILGGVEGLFFFGGGGGG